MVRGNCQER